MKTVSLAILGCCLARDIFWRGVRNASNWRGSTFAPCIWGPQVLGDTPEHRRRPLAAQPFIIRDGPRAGFCPLGAPRISNASDARFTLHTAPLRGL